MTDLTSLPASDLAQRIAGKELSATEAVGAFVGRADALDVVPIEVVDK